MPEIPGGTKNITKAKNTHKDLKSLGGTKNVTKAKKTRKVKTPGGTIPGGQKMLKRPKEL